MRHVVGDFCDALRPMRLPVKLGKFTRLLMKVLLRPLALAALCLYTLASHAETLPPHWRYVAKAQDMMYYLDTKNIEVRGKYLAYWTLVSFNHAKKFEQIKPYKSARILIYADCTAGMQDTKSVLQYDTVTGEGDAIWASHMDDEDLIAEPVKHGSINARLMAIACTTVLR
jgi:hypothetical protein